MMARRKAQTLEELMESADERWVWMPEGLNVKVIDLPDREERCVHIELTAAQARRLKTRRGEYVEAIVSDRSLDLVRLKRPKPKRTRASSSR